MIEDINWIGGDYRDYLACTRYILFRCCKKTQEHKVGEDIVGWEHSVQTKYEPIDFMDFKWIVDRCNFLLAKTYGIHMLPTSFLGWHEDSHFVPESFNADFTCQYKKQKNGKFKKYKPKYELNESSFISEAEQWAMNKIIWRWKAYGRFCIKLSNLYWKLKHH